MTRVFDAIAPDLPLVGRREFAEMQAFEVEVEDPSTEIPTQQIEVHQAIVVQVDGEADVDLGTITLGPGGFIVVYNGTPSVSPPTVSPTGDPIVVRGIVFGGPAA